MKKLLILLLFPALCLAQKQAPQSIIAGQVARDSTQSVGITLLQTGKLDLSVYSSYTATVASILSSKLDVSLYLTNRTADQAATSTAQATANAALTTANSATATGATNTAAISGLSSATTTLSNSITTTNQAVAGKQATLVSGSNIKTINGVSPLGPGDIVIAGSGGGVTTDASSLTAGTLSDARLSSNVVSLSAVQSLTGKTVNGVAPATFGFLDPTSSVQTQINGKQALLNYTPLNPANNLSELTNISTARTNLGLGSLATQSGTFSGSSSGSNTGDETAATIKTKLGVTTLSGSNTGDQDLSGKQNVLTPGTNIAIVGNTISVTGISSGGAATTDASSLTTGTLSDARLNNVGTAGTLGGGGQIVESVTRDAKGRVTGITTIATPTGGSGSSQWTTSGSSIYYTGGNVGVGLTNPDGGIHLKMATDSYQKGFTVEAASNDRLHLFFEQGGWTWDSYRFSDARRVSLNFQPNGGNVGFGTRTPSEKVEISGNLKVSGGIRFSDGTLQTTAASGSGGGTATPVYSNTATTLVELQRVLNAATPSSRIALMPGTYDFGETTFNWNPGGKADITIYAGNAVTFAMGSQGRLLIGGSSTRLTIDGVLFSCTATTGNSIAKREGLLEFNERGSHTDTYVTRCYFTSPNCLRNGIGGNTYSATADGGDGAISYIIRFKIKSCAFISLGGMGGEFLNHTWSDNRTDVTITDFEVEGCYFFDLGRYNDSNGTTNGMAFSLSGRARRFRFINCNVVDSNTYGLELVGTDGAVVDGCTFDYVNKSYIPISLADGYGNGSDATRNIVIGDCYLRSKTRPFNARGTTFLAISNSHFIGVTDDNSPNSNMYFQKCAGVSISGGSISTGSYNPLRLDDCREFIIDIPRITGTNTTSNYASISIYAGSGYTGAGSSDIRIRLNGAIYKKNNGITTTAGSIYELQPNNGTITGVVTY